MLQQTLKNPIKIDGIGLHSGCNVSLEILPAEPNAGIVFFRSDIAGNPEIKADFRNVVDTRNCTCLSDKQGNVVSTIEHLMAALRMSGIDNALIGVNNQELPIMDGSAKAFYDILSQAEKTGQNSPRKILRVLKTVSFSDNNGNTVSLSPSEKNVLHVCFEIDFPSAVVGHQKFENDILPDVFASEISPCRTFCEKYQVDYLKSIGLIKGGSLENAVVLDGDTILNKDGFRLPDECVNHKVLDAIGDLYTSGYVIYGNYKACKTGHFHNNELLKLLFADTSNYQIEEE